MSATITLRRRVQFGSRGRKPDPTHPVTDVLPSRIPRIARLMALAIRLETLLSEGHVSNAAALAELAHVSPAHVTQITNLTLLAPDIQEALLFLPPVEKGRDPITERDLRPFVAERLWSRQRKMWAELIAATSNPRSAQSKF